ncbi:MAG: FAD-dependent monooxygenase, partial [Pseudoruegeria sp.]
VTERDGGGYCINTAQGGEHKASCLIGADGIHSPIRQFLNGASAPFFTHQVAWRATVPNDADVAHKVQVHMGPGRHIVGYPLRGGELINIVAVQEKQAWVEESWTKKDDPDHLRAIFSDFAPSVRSLLSRIEEVHQWGLFRHSVAKTWYRGQAAILGDAAHPTLPFLAQGACMALEDAWVLAESLAQTDEISVGLAQYQSKRKDRVTRVVDAATKNAWRYHLSFPPLRFATHTALRTAGALAPSMAIRQFDWLYRTDVTKA